MGLSKPNTATGEDPTMPDDFGFAAGAAGENSESSDSNDKPKESKEESKEEAFRRLSAPRVNKIVDDLRILSNLGDSDRYDYTEADVDAMFAHIDEALSRAKRRYGKKEPFMPKFSWDTKE